MFFLQRRNAQIAIVQIVVFSNLFDCCRFFVILVELHGALDEFVFFSVRALRSCFEKLMSMRGARGPMRIL